MSKIDSNISNKRTGIGVTIPDIFRDRRSGNDRRGMSDDTEGTFLRCRRNPITRRKISAQQIGNEDWWLDTSYIDFLK